MTTEDEEYQVQVAVCPDPKCRAIHLVISENDEIVGTLNLSNEAVQNLIQALVQALNPKDTT